MAKAAGKSTGKARAAAKPAGAAARSKRSPSNARRSESASPASAGSNGAVVATNEPEAQASIEGEEQPDEEELLADVSSILDPLVMHSEAEDASLTVPTPAAASAASPVTVAPTATAAASSNDAAIQAAQLMARQHAEYQRSVELVRQQLAHRHMQQMQQTQQHHLQLQQQHQLYQQQMASNAASPGGASASVMHHIQQRLQERIQHKQLYDQLRQQAAAGTSTDAATQQQQLQIQQYHAMIRELEMQAAAAAAAAAASSTPTTPSTTGMSEEELERMRQERLQRLHQMQVHKMQQQQMQLHAQHAAALRVTLTGVPPVASGDAQQQRTQMHLDLERLVQLQQQQLLSGSETTSTSASPAQEPAQPSSKPLSKTAKAPSKKRAADQLTAAASTTDTKVEPATTNTAPSIVSSSATATPLSSPTAASAPPKKKRKTPAESQMEALVRVLCRLQLAKNENEMRSQLEKFAAWINKSADVCLLRFAVRDFVDIFGLKQKQFEKSPHWPSDLLPKCTFTHDKLRHAITTLDQTKIRAEQTSTTHAAPLPSHTSAVDNVPMPSTVASAAPAAAPKTIGKLNPPNAAEVVTQAAREHAYAALKEQMLATLTQPKPRAAPTAKSIVQAGASVQRGAGAGAGDVAADPGSQDTSISKTKKRDLSIDVNTDNTDKVVKIDGVATPSVSEAAKSAPPIRPAPNPLASGTIISPRVAQHLFDLELAPRSCAVGPDEGEDRFYFPLKPISTIMRSILPGGGPIPVRRKRKKRRTAADIENGESENGAKKAKEEEDDDDDDGEDGEGDVGADDGDDHEAKDGDDEDDGKGGKERESVSGDGALSATTAAARMPDEPAIKIDDDALTFMQECVTEFILFFTSEARDQAAYDKKKGSITGMNLAKAFDNLGFSPYAKVLANYNDKVRKVQDEAAHQKQERKNLAKQRRLQAEKLKQQEAEKTKQSTAQIADDAAVKTETPTVSASGSGPSTEPPAGSSQTVNS